MQITRQPLWLVREIEMAKIAMGLKRLKRSAFQEGKLTLFWGYRLPACTALSAEQSIWEGR